MASHFSQQQDDIDEQSLTLQVQIDRDVYAQHEFDTTYGYTDQTGSQDCKESVRNGCNWMRNNCRCSVQKLWPFILGHLPILAWLPKYSIRRDLVYDIIGGLTVGVMHIPQGMAYGILAGLDQVNGLYTSFFASLVYVLLGTSRHVSIGTFAVISIMMGNVRDRLIPRYDPNQTISTVSNTTAPPDFPHLVTPVELSMTVTVLVGIVLLCMFLLRLGFLTSYLSDALISGFTTGAAVHVLATQIPPILGVKKPQCGEVGKLVCTIGHLATTINLTNPITLAISAVCVVVVYVMKEYMSPIFRRKTNLPLPGELIAIVVGTIASYYGGFNRNLGVDIVGDMPTGLPKPALPRMDIAVWVIGDSISIAIVVFSVTVSVAKIFAKKHHYSIDANQELLALGLVQCFCSMFSCFPPSGSLARSALFESTGTRTQVAAIIGCGVVLVVLLWLGPLFYCLPTCVLAAIIIVALKGMFMQFREFTALLRISRIDAFIWMSSFVAVVSLGVTYGLAASVVIGLLTLILRLQWPHSALLTWIPETELYKDKDRYAEGQIVYGVKIFRFDAPLNFANAERFKARLFDVCQVDVERSKTYLRTCTSFPPSPPPRPLVSNGSVEENACSSPATASKCPPQDENGNEDATTAPCASRNDSTGACSTTAGLVSLDADENETTTMNYIIIDCSAFTYLDMMGMEILKQVYQDLTKIGIRVLFAACRASLRPMFESSTFHRTIPRECLYVTIHDAVMAATGGNIVGMKIGVSPTKN